MRSNRFDHFAPVFSQSPFSFFFFLASLPVIAGGVSNSKAFGTVSTLPVQESSSDDTKSTSAPDEKVLRYHKALQRRPVPGYLFDRFYNSWLDSSSTNELKSFLVKQAEASKKTADRLLLAFFYAKQEEDALAIEQFRLALKNDPGNADVLYEKAVVEARTLDFESALTDLDAALKLKPKSETQIKIGKLQGTLHARNLENEKAMEVWNKMIESNPDDEALKEDLIDLQIREGMQKQALELLEKLIAQTRDPYKKVMRSLRKGDIYQRTGEREKALTVYDSTLEQVGMNTWIEREILAQIGQVYRREDDLTGLAEHYAKLVESNSKRIALRKVHAKLLMQIGNSDEAINVSKKIVELTPGDRSNRESLIDLLTAGQEFEQAVKQTEALIAQFPKDAELHIRLAGIHRLREKLDEAAQSLIKYLDAAGKTEYAYLRTGRLLEKYKLKDNAKTVFEDCLKAFPDSVSAKESYALFLFQNGEKDNAISIWTKLAEGGDKTQVVRVARIFASRQLHQNAFDLLKSRLDDFASDPIYLGQLCLEADALKKYEESLPWAIKRVELSADAVALELCLGQTVRTIEKAEKAAEKIKQISSDENASISMRCLMAELLSRSGQADQAEKQLKAWIKQVTDDSNLDTKSRTSFLQMLGQQRIRIYSGLFDWASAAQAAKELVELPGGNTAFNLKRLVDLLVRSGQQETALEWTTRWKKAAPNSSAPWLRESGILVSIGKGKESVDVLRNATRKFPGEPDLFLELAERYTYIDQYEDAERIYWIQYEEAESLSDKLRWAERLAQHFYYYADESELVKNFEERRKNNPTSIDPILALAQIHRILENYEDRRDALAEALRLQPENIQLIHDLAQTEETEGEWEAAITTLQTAEKLDKTYRTRQKMAAIYFKYDELQKGLDILAEIAGGLNAAPRDVEKIVDAIVENDEWQIALDFILPHVSRHPTDYRLRYQLGVIQEELELFEPARQTFLELLRMDQEIPGLNKNQPNMNPYGGFLEEVEEFLPPQATEVWTILQSSDMAYTHRRRSRSRYSYGYYGFAGSVSHVMLPKDLKEMRSLAINHLVNLMIESPDSSRENTLEIMKDRGVQEAKLLWSILSETSFDGLFENGPDVFISLLEENKDNQTMLALYTFLATNGIEFDESQETLEKAFDLFKEDYASLAFVNAGQLITLGKNDKEFNKEMIAVAKKIKNPGRLHFQMLYGLLQFDGKDANELPRGKSFNLDKDLKKELGSLMEQWVTEIRKKDDSPYYIFHYIADYYQTQKKPEEYIQMLEDEIARYKTELKRQPTSRWSRYGYGYFDPDDDGLTFPPEFMEFPSDVAELFQGDDDSGFGYRFDGPPSIDESDDQDFVKKYSGKLDSIKNPILKLLFEFEIASKKSLDLDEPKSAFETVSKNAANLVEANPKDLDTILMAASIANHLEDFSAVNQYLTKTDALPLDRYMRQRIDSAFLSNALKFEDREDLESEKAKEIVDNAKVAIKRMLRANLSHENRSYLISSMSQLGLDDEVESIAKKANQFPTNPNISGLPFSSSFSGPSTNSGMSRVQKFMEEGKKDVALRTLAQQIRPLAKMMTDIDTSYEVEDEMLLEVRRVIHVYELESDILEYLANSQSRSGKMALAAAHQIVLKKEKASELYSAILSEYPREDGVRYQLLQLLVETNPKEFLQQYSQVEKDKQNAFSPLISYFFSTVKSPDDDVEFVKTLCELIEQADPEQRESFANLADTVLDYFSVTDDEEEADYYGPPGYDLSDLEEKKEPTEEEKKRKADRLNTHEKLCKLMIQHFQSKSAFTSLLGSIEAQKEKEVDKAQFEQYAVDIIKKTPPKKPGRDRYPPSPYGSSRFRSKGSYRSYSRARRSTVSPQRYVEENVVADPSPEKMQQTKDFIQYLRDNKNTELADQFDRLSKLYWASESDYKSAAETFLKESVKSTRDTSGLATAMNKVLQVWGKRKLKVDMFDLVDQNQKEVWKRTRRSGDYDNEIGLSYLRELTKQGELERAEKVLNQFIVHIFGDEDKIESLIESQMKLMRRGTGGRQLASYSSLVRDLLRSDYLFWMGLDQVSKHPEIAEIFTSDYALENKVESLSSEEDIDAFLRRTPFTKELEDFDPIYLESMPLPYLSSYLPTRFRYLDNLSVFTAHAKKMKDESFGGQAWKILFTKTDRIGGLVELVGKNLEAFRKLPKERQKGIAMFVFMHSDDEIYESFQPEELAGKSKEAYDMLKNHVAERLTANLDKPKTNRNERDYYGDSDIFSDSEQIGMVLDFFDMQSALKICKKVIAAEEKQRGGFNDPYDRYSEYSPINSMILDRCNYFRINLMLEVLKSPDFNSFALEVYGLNRFFSERLDKLTVAEQPVEGLKAFYKEMGEKLEGRDPIGLLRVLTQVIGERFPIYTPDEMAEDNLVKKNEENVKTLKEVIAWAEKEAESGDHPKLAKVIYLATHLAQATPDPEAEYFFSIKPAKPNKELSSYQKSLFDLLNSKELSDNLRINLALVVGFDPTLPQNDILKCANVILEKVDKKTISDFRTPLAVMLNRIDKDNEGWKDAADRWWKACGQTTWLEQTDQYELADIVPVLAAMGKQNAINLLLREQVYELTDSRTILGLMDAGLYRQARKVMEYQIENDLEHSSPEIFYTSDIHKQLPELVSQFTDPQMKLAIELYFVSLKDPKTDENQAPIKRSERLKDIAQRYLSVPQKSEALNRHLLAILSAEPDCYPIVKDTCLTAVKKVTPLHIWGRRNTGSEGYDKNREMLLSHAVARLNAGEPEPFQFMISVVKREHPAFIKYLNNEYSSQYMFERFGSMIGKLYTDADNDKKKYIYDELISLAKTQPMFCNNESIVTVLFIGSIANNDLQALNELKESVEKTDDEKKKAMSRYGYNRPNWQFSLDSIWKTLVEMDPKINKGSADERFETTKRIWSSAKELNASVGSGDFQNGVRDSCDSCRVNPMGLEEIVLAKLLSEKELAEQGSELAQINPVDGEIWRQIAYYQLKFDMKEQAAESFRKAMEATPKKLDKAKSNRTVEYAKALVEIGKTEEARKQLKSVNSVMLIRDNIGRYEKLNNQLNGADSSSDQQKDQKSDQQSKTEESDKKVSSNAIGDSINFPTAPSLSYVQA